MVSLIESKIAMLDEYFSEYDFAKATPHLIECSLAVFIIYVTGIRSGSSKNDNGNNEKDETGVGLLSIKNKHIKVIKIDDSKFLMHLRFYGKYRTLFDKKFPIPLQIANLITKCKGSAPDTMLFNIKKSDLYAFINKQFGMDVSFRAFRKLRFSAYFETTLNSINSNNDASLVYLSTAADKTLDLSNHSRVDSLVYYLDARILALFLDRFSIQTSSYNNNAFKNVISHFIKKSINFEWSLLVNKFLYSKNVTNDKYNLNIIYHQSKYWNF